LNDLRVELREVERDFCVISYKVVSFGVAYCKGVGPRLRVEPLLILCIGIVGAEYGLPTSNGGLLRPLLSTFADVTGRRNNGG
jgi:hypothetical protein